MRYGGRGEPVLKSVSFTVPGGTKLGVVGRTGAGKSSIAAALFRLVEIDEGAIRIDGIDVSTVGLHTLRRRMAIVPQVNIHKFTHAMHEYVSLSQRERARVSLQARSLNLTFANCLVCLSRRVYSLPAPCAPSSILSMNRL
jgi:ABC-type bacteriocin/lantibiotic exporter with double-glycine peptidase domain